MRPGLAAGQWRKHYGTQEVAAASLPVLRGTIGNPAAASPRCTVDSTAVATMHFGDASA
jgi:hypothetical protein